MKLPYIPLFLTLGLVLVSSCQEDLLEQQNPNAPTTETFFTTAENANLAVIAAYSSLQALGTYSRWLHFAYMLRADEGFSSSPWGELANFTRFIQSNYNFEPSESTWQDHYRGIFRTNQIITNLERPELEIEEELKGQLIAEARFIRALLYYNLASLYGNVPLALEPSTITYRATQGTTGQVWQQVIDDLTAAKPNLPPVYEDQNNLGRATRGAATALLGKVYMQLNQYPDAERELGEVVNSNLYDLVPNYVDNFTEAGENNVESVFEVQFSGELRGGDQDQSSASEGNNRAQFFGPPGDGFTDGEARPWVRDEFLTESDRNGNVDLRLGATLLYNKHLNPSQPAPADPDTLVYGEGFNTRYPRGTPNNQRLYWRKYQNDRTRDFENFDSPINFRVTRFADVLLLYAEALSQNGQPEAAYPYINRVRNRANLPTLEEAGKAGLTQAQLFTQIQHERAVELAGEGTRWNDLKRWGWLDDPARSPELQQRDPDFNTFEIGKSALLPLPQTDVDISGYEQNPNW